MGTNNRDAKAKLLASMVTSLELFLNPKVLENDEIKRQINDHLTNGNLVVIREALQKPFAERMFECLDRFSDWKVYEDYSTEFHYHHHNIYDNVLFPPDLNRCREIFGSEPTKSLIQKLSGSDCTGATVLSASLYLPGDHSLPHDDSTGVPGAHRQVAFIWHLTKNWQANWGGDLFWCKKNRYLSPSFNSLILFNVREDNYHLVTAVSPYAKSKRLAISGWWTSKEAVRDYSSDVQAKNTDKKTLLELI